MSDLHSRREVRAIRAYRNLCCVMALGSLGACDQLFDITERPQETTDGGPGDIGTFGDDTGAAEDSTALRDTGMGLGDADAHSTDDSGPTAACPASEGGAPGTLYVSPSGSDANPGCRAAPKATIAAALGAAKARTATTILVCKGTYNETALHVDFLVSIGGGYDCSTWLRTSTYGYPMFDAVNETTITNGSPMTQSASVVFSSTAVGSSVALDGFTVRGAMQIASTNPAAAVACTNGAAPTLSNNKLTGGNVTLANVSPASTGVGIYTGSSPTIKNNMINGGSGALTTAAPSGFASVGILTDGTTRGSVTIVDNVIDGGSGSSMAAMSGGSLAMVLNGVATDGGSPPTWSVTGNKIMAGSGTSPNGADTDGVLVIGNANATITGNSIEGKGSSGAVCSYGLDIDTSGNVAIMANRISGGTCMVQSTTTAPHGVLVAQAGSLVVRDNMIYSGDAITAVNPAALQLGTGTSDTSVVGADVRHNTFVAGSTVLGGISFALGINLAKGAVIENNILAGTSTSAGLYFNRCSGANSLSSFQNNLVFNTPMGMSRDLCMPSDVYTTIQSMETSLQQTQTGATVLSNVTVASSCGTDSGCIVSEGCTDSTSCLATIFSGFSAIPPVDLFPPSPFAARCSATGNTVYPPMGNGWTLSSSAPCTVSRSSLQDNSIVSTDLYGNCWKPMPSMGAEEYGDTCQ